MPNFVRSGETGQSPNCRTSPGLYRFLDEPGTWSKLGRKMESHQRPKGLTETALLMSLTNALGWFIVDWSNRHAATTFSLFTIFIFVGYLVIWFYWRGGNWARLLVLLTSLLCLYNLRYFFRGGIMERSDAGASHELLSLRFARTHQAAERRRRSPAVQQSHASVTSSR